MVARSGPTTTKLLEGSVNAKLDYIAASVDSLTVRLNDVESGGSSSAAGPMSDSAKKYCEDLIAEKIAASPVRSPSGSIDGVCTPGNTCASRMAGASLSPMPGSISWHIHPMAGGPSPSFGSPGPASNIYSQLSLASSGAFDRAVHCAIAKTSTKKFVRRTAVEQFVGTIWHDAGIAVLPRRLKALPRGQVSLLDSQGHRTRLRGRVNNCSDLRRLKEVCGEIMQFQPLLEQQCQCISNQISLAKLSRGKLVREGVLAQLHEAHLNLKVMCSNKS